MKNLSSMKTPPGLLAVIRGCELKDLDSLNEYSARWIGLENIGDPGNLGTIIRSAAWFGFDRMLLIGECVDPYNSKVVQASMGSFWNVRFYKTGLTKLSQSGLPLIAADMYGSDYRQFEWPQEFCLILGNESHGLSQALISIANQRLSIPSITETVTDSLNISVTAGILMASSAK
jgi:TrmH family RNA methyltransferase